MKKVFLTAAIFASATFSANSDSAATVKPDRLYIEAQYKLIELPDDAAALELLSIKTDGPLGAWTGVPAIAFKSNGNLKGVQIESSEYIPWSWVSGTSAKPVHTQNEESRLQLVKNMGALMVSGKADDTGNVKFTAYPVDNKLQAAVRVDHEKWAKLFANSETVTGYMIHGPASSSLSELVVAKETSHERAIREVIPRGEVMKRLSQELLRSAQELACITRWRPREVSVKAALEGGLSFIVEGKGSVEFAATWDTSDICEGISSQK